MDLRIDPDELNTCVQCGLCLPFCPTFRVTGDEAFSPRGRIALMRQVQDHDAPLTDEVIDSFATCIQCRGCEPACPSGVPYGHLIEATRETLAEEGILTPWWQRLALEPLTRPHLLRVGTALLSAVNRVGLVPKRLGLPSSLPFRSARLKVSGDEVYLFTGCVMDAWQRDVHAAVKRVIEATGVTVTPTGDDAPCCGALHTHAGLGDRARRLAEQVMHTLEDRPVLVDSAGCGAAMKEYGRLLGTDEARAFSARVFDVSEWLVANVDLPEAEKLDIRVAVQDPCHLRHVQKVHLATRTVLAPYVRELVELDDEGLCCGAGGAFSVLQPELAGQVRDRKVAAIDRARPDWVASANPGCSLHLAAADVPTIHPLQIIDAALRGVALDH